MPHFSIKMKSPVGELTLVASENHLVAVLWEEDTPGRVKLPAFISNQSHPILRETKKQLEEYFAGKRRFFDLPIEITGTEFQKKVLKVLRTVPYGETWSYSELARRVGRPKAFRAVGAANGRNPLSIIYPCHRVVGKSGSLTGFAGGLKNKKVLLDLEQQKQGSSPQN